ncbi:MAG: hypothetical protein HYV60_19465 [Planctomycetia bacterium]|nr:hypothetical protein [Planctomycetia bacterium]
MKLLSANDVCQCLSTRKKKFPYQTLNTWIKRGYIKPIKGAGGTGHHRVFSIVDVVAIAAGRGLRDNGYEPGVANGVTAIIQGMSEEKLLAEFKAGRTCLMIVGKQVAPVLMKRAAIVDNPESIDYAAAAAIGLSPAALDVKRIYDNIVALADSVEAKKKSKA